MYKSIFRLTPEEQRAKEIEKREEIFNAAIKELVKKQAGNLKGREGMVYNDL
jgi:hypothetical protein